MDTFSNDRVFVIAEAGVNHNGDVTTALRMVREAKAAGADAVKFQTFRAEDLVTAYAPKAEYQKREDGASSQYEMLKRLELTDDEFVRVKAECDRVGIEFMSTPFSVTAARFLETLGMRTWKIPSGEITNLPLLEYVGRVAPVVIMSTGMADMHEIGEAVEALVAAGLDRSRLYVLHCTTSYPTPPSSVNLRAMETLRSVGAVAGVGYSDHTSGTAVPVAAVGAGAVIIEKHFTLDRDMEGPDHKASLTPDEFASMVRDIRTAWLAMGSARKEPADIERPNMAVARKSVVAARPIAPGEVFTEANLTTKRPGNGISPMRWHCLIGRRALRAYDVDDLIESNELN